jgi:alpha-L-fucosidase
MFSTFQENLDDFGKCRLGIFIHYGLFSLLERGEWVLNREGIPIDEYKQLASGFTASRFDADKLVLLAKNAGAKYIVFTTMHHDGFALYDSQINEFNCLNSPCGRDLVSEVIEACRKHNIRIHLYHSLNNQTTVPNGSDALEDNHAKKKFVDYTHERIKELVTKYNPIDCLWYDGWWPFTADGWRAVDMNKMVREIQPQIILNGRNGLAGDFATPEQHLTAPKPWRPWEACITHNANWGYHAGDNLWKSPLQIIESILHVASGAGNLLLNVGPKADGGIPDESMDLLTSLSEWFSVNSSSVYESDRFDFDLRSRGDCRGDFLHHGKYTCVGNRLYMHLLSWPGSGFSIFGVETTAQEASVLGFGKVNIRQDKKRLTFELPENPPFWYGGVVEVLFQEPPIIYNTAGIRVPKTKHPRYDPLPAD